MGVAMYYRTTQPVGNTAWTVMELAMDACTVRWWGEGLCLWRDEDGTAWGGSKIFRRLALTPAGVVEAIDEGEDTVMAWNDCRAIIAELTRLSQQHGVTWRLSIEDMELGHVTPAGPDDDLEDAMWHFLDSSGLGIGEEEAPGAVARIWRRYPPEV